METQRIKFIIKIKCNSKKYDIETENHNYFANNILVHNSNFSVTYNPDRSRSFGSRNQKLGDNSNFNSFQDVLKNTIRFNEFDSHMKYYSQFFSKSYIVYGEIFGSGILKRIEYGSKKVRFYDIYNLTDNVFLPVSESKAIIDMYDLYPPVVNSLVTGIKNVLEYSNEFQSYLTPEGYEKDNTAEGFVAVPYYRNYYSKLGARFILKSKGPKFQEKMKHKTNVNKVIKELDPVFRSLSKEAEEYVNENRILSTISKLGQPESMKDFSTYIREITRDYQEDFRKDHEEELECMSKEEIKKIFKSANNYATVLLKKFILKGGTF